MLQESLTRIAEGDSHRTDLDRANAEDRIQYGGPGLELIRRAYVDRCRDHMDAFWDHGSLADIVALCAAFDLIDRDRHQRCENESSRGALIEALLAVLGLPAHELLDRHLRTGRDRRTHIMEEAS